MIGIDQLRADYLQRFRPYFGSGGFNWFLRQGASFANAEHRHAITSTCPGHAVILTGSHGNVNGIVSNYWYDVVTGREVYCVADSQVSLVGKSGKGRSPRNLIGYTVGDELTLATRGGSRIVTVAGKDRSAIMLGGHLADAAYWTSDTLFVSSSYYMKQLPAWVQEFNSSRRFVVHAGKSWDRLLPVSSYTGPDDAPGEERVDGRRSTFPHLIPAPASLELFTTSFEYSPFHNEVIAEFALRAVTEEGLGADGETDLLGIGFSALDRVGHAYGPHSHEVMDLMIRTDRLLEQMFSSLAKRIGRENLLLVLTADHGVAPLPETVKSLNPAALAGRVHPDTIVGFANSALVNRYGPAPGPGWIVHHSAPMLYLNLPALRARGASVQAAELVAKTALLRLPSVHDALTATELEQLRNGRPRSSAVLSFNPERSGHIYYQLRPYFLLSEEPTGADHGSRWTYDTRVPLLWYGPGVKPGVYYEEAAIADIAPTLAELLSIPVPAGSEGRILYEMFR